MSLTLLSLSTHFQCRLSCICCQVQCQNMHSCGAGGRLYLLQVPRNDLANMLLLIFEHELGSKGKAGSSAWTGSFEIEHILPQSIADLDGWRHWSPEAHQQWQHRLGNLALIDSGDNKQFSNSPFSAKMGLIGENKSKFSKTLIHLHEQFEGQEWDEVALQARHQKLQEILRARWLLGSGTTSGACLICLAPVLYVLGGNLVCLMASNWTGKTDR